MAGIASAQMLRRDDHAAQQQQHQVEAVLCGEVDLAAQAADRAAWWSLVATGTMVSSAPSGAIARTTFLRAVARIGALSEHLPPVEELEAQRRVVPASSVISPSARRVLSIWRAVVREWSAGAAATGCPSPGCDSGSSAPSPTAVPESSTTGTGVRKAVPEVGL
jgi:hypothetical protein